MGGEKSKFLRPLKSHHKPLQYFVAHQDSKILKLEIHGSSKNGPVSDHRLDSAVVFPAQAGIQNLLAGPRFSPRRRSKVQFRKSSIYKIDQSFRSVSVISRRKNRALSFRLSISIHFSRILFRPPPCPPPRAMLFYSSHQLFQPSVFTRGEESQPGFPKRCVHTLAVGGGLAARLPKICAHTLAVGGGVAARLSQKMCAYSLARRERVAKL